MAKISLLDTVVTIDVQLDEDEQLHVKQIYKALLEEIDYGIDSLEPSSHDYCEDVFTITFYPDEYVQASDITAGVERIIDQVIDRWRSG